MFERLELLQPDPILGLLAMARADKSSQRVDLGVGVYKDEQGATPVLAAVSAAEQAILQQQQTKVYLGPAGNEQFNSAIASVVLGANHPALREGRAQAMQAPGGCGALRIGAELLATTNKDLRIHVSDPTWANHVPLLGGVGLLLGRYPYYNTASGSVDFDAMLEKLDALPAGDVVLLHGACHNPTGADLSLEQWKVVAHVLRERALIPFIDLAYQGLGDGLEQDAAGLRWIARSVPETLIAVSCSKNFGLYRERVGALITVCQHQSHTEAALSHLRRIARGLYSMPPDHGAAVVAQILGDPKLDQLWRQELERMRVRISGLRLILAQALAHGRHSRDFSAIARQRGMFSMLDLPVRAVDRLREKNHIYMTSEGRINIAGLCHENVEHVARAIEAAL